MSVPDAIGPDRTGRRDRFYRWLLLTGNRTTIVATLTATTFLVVVVATGGSLPPDRTPAVPVLRLSAGLTGGLLPFITLVLTINQLALSMELGSVFHLDRRLDAMREFRSDVADLTGRDTCPVAPAPLLTTLFAETDERASRLADSDAEALADYGDRLGSETASIRDRFSSNGDMFDALVAARRFSPGAHLQAVEQLRSGADGGDCADALDELEQLHEHLDVAQKYFWMVYTEDEMAMLARHVLYTGFLGIATGVALLLGLDSLIELGVVGWRLTLVVAAGITLEVLPFAVLFAHMLRITTVARTSAGFGPFVTDGPGWD